MSLLNPHSSILIGCSISTRPQFAVDFKSGSWLIPSPQLASGQTGQCWKLERKKNQLMSHLKLLLIFNAYSPRHNMKTMELNTELLIRFYFARKFWLLCNIEHTLGEPRKWRTGMRESYSIHLMCTYNKSNFCRTYIMFYNFSTFQLALENL